MAETRDDIPVYYPSQGIVDYEVDGQGRDVVIAGKIRTGIREGRPDLVAIYENEDRVNASERNSIMAKYLEETK